MRNMHLPPRRSKGTPARLRMSVPLDRIKAKGTGQNQHPNKEAGAPDAGINKCGAHEKELRSCSKKPSPERKKPILIRLSVVNGGSRERIIRRFSTSSQDVAGLRARDETLQTVGGKRRQAVGPAARGSVQLARSQRRLWQNFGHSLVV